MNARRILALVAAQLLIAGAAQATTVSTGALLRNGGQLACLVTNASPSPLTVDIRVMYEHGARAGGYSITLAPSETRYSSSTSATIDHCEFTFPGNPKRVRALVCSGPVGGPCTATAPAQ